MKTFSQFQEDSLTVILEQAGKGFAAMTDQDFERWVKANPGAAEKARKVRAEFLKTYNTAKQSSGTQQTPPRGTSTASGEPFNATGKPGSPGNSQGGYSTPRNPTGNSTSTPPGPNKPPSGATSGTSSRVNVSPGQALRVAGNVAQAGFVGYDIYDKTKERQAQGERLRTAIPKSAAEAGGGLAGSVAAVRAAAPITARLKNPYAIGAANLAIASGGYWGGERATSDIVKKLEGPDVTKDMEKTAQSYGMRKSKVGMQKANTYGATSGSGIRGIGGPTTVSKTDRGSFISTGSGAQRKTAQLASTQLIRDPKSGKQVVGDLAFKGGQATYVARPSTASRDSNATPEGAWRNVQRSLNFGGQRERDAVASKREYRTALQNTQQYTKKLGITPQSAAKQKLPGYGKA